MYQRLCQTFSEYTEFDTEYDFDLNGNVDIVVEFGSRYLREDRILNNLGLPKPKYTTSTNTSSNSKLIGLAQMVESLHTNPALRNRLLNIAMYHGWFDVLDPYFQRTPFAFLIYAAFYGFSKTFHYLLCNFKLQVATRTNPRSHPYEDMETIDHFVPLNFLIQPRLLLRVLEIAFMSSYAHVPSHLRHHEPEYLVIFQTIYSLQHQQQQHPIPPASSSSTLTPVPFGGIGMDRELSPIQPHSPLLDESAFIGLRQITSFLLNSSSASTSTSSTLPGAGMTLSARYAIKIAAREGYLDLVKQMAPLCVFTLANKLGEALAIAAASKGQIHVLKWLAKVSVKSVFGVSVAPSEIDTEDEAETENGHQHSPVNSHNSYQFNINIHPAGIWTSEVLNAAISHNQITTLHFLHTHLPALLTPLLNTNIASMNPSNTLSSFTFTISHPSPTALDIAASRGHLEPLKWSYTHHHPHTKPSHAAINDALANGHLEVVEWLLDTYYRSSLSSSPSTNNSHNNADTKPLELLSLRLAARNGHLNIIQYIFNPTSEHRHPRTHLFDVPPTDPTSDDALEPQNFFKGGKLHRIATNGHLELLQYLHATFGIEMDLPVSVMDLLCERAGQANNDHNCSTKGKSFETYFEILRWVEKEFGCRCSLKGLVSAVKGGGDVNLVTWVLEKGLKAGEFCGTGKEPLKQKEKLEMVKSLKECIEIAVTTGDMEILGVVLEYMRHLGVEMPGKEEGFWFHLTHLAAVKGHLKMVRYIVLWMEMKGCSKSEVFEDDGLAKTVSQAACLGFKEVVECLLNIVCQDDELGKMRTAVLVSAANKGAKEGGHLGMVTWLEREYGGSLSGENEMEE
jgi:hypothetical protein